MEPIVNPWFIYLLALCDDVKIVAVIALIVTMIGVGIMFVFRMACISDNDEKEFKSVAPTYRAFKWAMVVALFLTLAIPSKGTVIGMIVAKNVTPVNIEKAVKTGKVIKDEVKKDVLDIIQALTKEEKKEEKEKK